MAQDPEQRRHQRTEHHRSSRYSQAGQNLTYVPPGFVPGAFIVVPNISTSTSYYKRSCNPGTDSRPSAGTDQRLFDSKGNVSGCQDPQVIPASLFDNNGILYLNSPSSQDPTLPGKTRTSPTPLLRSTSATTSFASTTNSATSGASSATSYTTPHAGVSPRRSLACAGKLQHHHQHPDESFLFSSHQAERHHQSQPARRSQLQLRRQHHRHRQ